MSYTKTWTPPTIPYRDNLTAWKEICNDIHDNLLLAGVVQTEDSGQLDIDEVEELPADGTFEGYRVYRLNDSLASESPVYFRLDFGCGTEGLTTSAAYVRSRTLRIKTEFSNGSDGAGQLNSLAVPIQTQYPQTFNSTISNNNVQLTSTGTSYVCANEDFGFFGFLYGVGSRNKPYGTSGRYYGASLVIIIQRDQDVTGHATNKGFTVFCNSSSIISNVGDAWTTTPMPDALVSNSYHVNTQTSELLRQTVSGRRPFGNNLPLVDGVPQLCPVYTGTPRIEQVSTLVTYRTEDIPEGTEFQLEVIPNNTQNFIALGNECNMYPSDGTVQLSSFAMLYE